MNVQHVYIFHIFAHIPFKHNKIKINFNLIEFQSVIYLINKSTSNFYI